MLTVEFIAALLTLWSVYLTTNKHMLSWPVGIWAVVMYAAVFFDQKLYADFILQAFFAIQGVIGFIMWKYKGEVNRNQITKIETLTNKQRLFYLLPMIIVYLSAAYLLSTYTNASVPYIDSLVATLSLFANYLLIKRKIDNWYIWIVVNMLYIGLFTFKGLYVSMWLYVLLLGLAVKGYLDWKKIMAK